jgi:tRNA nucleotidyltransferase/poly(A) polymerase
MNWYKQTQNNNICDKPIGLTTLEKQIFNLLLTAKKTLPELQNIEMRIVGGWVRDHLLGLPSDDIDIALSNITGADFVKALRKLQSPAIGKTYIIEQNIEKSKHLATAAVDLFGQKVEFVNLRSEQYGNSRVPVMRMGTPQEDSERRDLMINALFFNIEMGKIEDYVGGCQDLDTMTLRTPLDPVKTFSDDPLRMLRVLRFYSRYPEAEIDPAVIQALSNPEVQSNYTKLSPERAAPELLKMMKGAKPAAATRILFESGLYRYIFDIPKDFIDISTSQRSHYHQYTLMEHTLKVIENINNLSQEANFSDDERALLNLSAIFHDFGKMSPEIRQPHPKRPGYYRYLGHEEVSAKLAKQIMTSMGFTPEAKKFVSTVVASHMKPHRSGMFEDKTKSRKKLGQFLNDVDYLYDKILLHGMADELAKGDLSEEERQDIIQSRQQEIDYTHQYREQMGTKINEPLINGNEIRNIISSVTYGRASPAASLVH